MDLPPTIKIVGSVPHDWLFPRCAAVCHHGGTERNERERKRGKKEERKMSEKRKCQGVEKRRECGREKERKETPNERKKQEKGGERKIRVRESN